MRLALSLHQHLHLCGIGMVWLILTSCSFTLPAVAEIVYTPVSVAISGYGRLKYRPQP